MAANKFRYKIINNIPKAFNLKKFVRISPSDALLILEQPKKKK